MRALFVGTRGDALLRPLAQVLGPELEFVDERALFDEGSLSVSLDRGQSAVAIGLAGRAIDLDGLTHVFVRPSRQWRPSGIDDPQDSVFVLHEVLAGWLTGFDALGDRVVNLPPVSWWLGDPLVPCRLAASLAEAMGVPWAQGGVGPLAPAAAGQSWLCLADGAVLSPAEMPADVDEPFRAAGAAVRRWQRLTGLRLAGVTVLRRPVRIGWVDPSPPLTGLPEAFLARVASSILRGPTCC